MRTIYIGKNVDNDFVVNDPTVSRKHAVITIMDDGRIILKDLNSTNGTFVNGKRIQSDIVLSSSDTILLGKYSIDLGRVIAHNNHTAYISKGDPNKKVIGRKNTCDICLPYDDVSGEHAVIERLSTGEIAISDKQSTNGTFVNGERVSYKVLHKGDIVTISKGHTLDWSSAFPVAIPNASKFSTKTLKIAAAVVALFILGASFGAYWIYFKPWSPSRTYKQYHSAVCMLYGQYAYTVSIDITDTDLANRALSLIGLDPDTYYSFDDEGDLQKGPSTYTGTGFFISKDGKMGTNLHIVKPWLYSQESQKLVQTIQQLYAAFGTQMPILNSIIPNIRVTGHLVFLGVSPNGLPLKKDNLTECVIVAAGDDIEKDVAIVQTVTHTLPNGVNTYIDINKSKTMGKATEQGKTVYVIGFPLGTILAQVQGTGEETVLENQIQTGTITQNRGNIEFGHNAPTFGGASGSPVLDEHGRLIGVHHAGLAKIGAHGFNWAIKVSHLLELNE